MNFQTSSKSIHSACHTKTVRVSINAFSDSTFSFHFVLCSKMGMTSKAIQHAPNACIAKSINIDTDSSNSTRVRIIKLHNCVMHNCNTIYGRWFNKNLLYAVARSQGLFSMFATRPAWNENFAATRTCDAITERIKIKMNEEGGDRQKMS